MITTEIALKSDLAGLARYVAENDQVMIAGDLLLFKKGLWYRAGNAFKPGDQAFLANPAEAMTGWVKWADGKPEDHRLVRILDYKGRIPREVLGDLDKNAWPTDDRGTPQDPWQPSDRILMRTMDTAEDLLTFVSGSRGGRNALARLMGKVARSVHYKDEGMCPVINLEADSYEHDTYGIVHVPEFKVIDWEHWNREMNTAKPKAITATADALNDSIPF
jgi:hypothetical protein